MFKPEFNLELLPVPVKMYLAAKALLVKLDTGYDIPADHMAVLEQVCNEFEADLGPIPDRAVCKNFGNQYIVGAQLYTTSGRRSGNGWIVEIREVAPSDRDCYLLYTVINEAGSVMKLTTRQLEMAFDAGDWIFSPERIIKDFDRHGHFNPKHPEEGEPNALR